MTVDLYRHSIDVIRAGQSHTGAYVAAPNIPACRCAWIRDGAFLAYAMDRVGEHRSARDFHLWAARTIRSAAAKVDILEAKAAAREPIQPHEWLHSHYTLDGRETEAANNRLQLDGYGAWLWSLCEHVWLTGDVDLLDQSRSAVDLVVRYLIRFWDQPGVDCWEENGDTIHASTLACLYGGLRSIWHTICNAGVTNVSPRWRDIEIEKVCCRIKTYVLMHFVHHGRLTKYANGDSVDASLLWVSVPFRLLEPQDPIMALTVSELERCCVTGGVYRYPEDRASGGGEWPALTAWLGWYHLAAGNLPRAKDLLAWVAQHADDHGDLPEHLCGASQDGQPREPVAKPQLWAHALYLILREEMQSSADA